MKNSKLDVFEKYEIKNQVWIYGGTEGDQEETDPNVDGGGKPVENPWWAFWG